MLKKWGILQPTPINTISTNTSIFVDLILIQRARRKICHLLCHRHHLPIAVRTSWARRFPTLYIIQYSTYCLSHRSLCTIKKLLNCYPYHNLYIWDLSFNASWIPSQSTASNTAGEEGPPPCKIYVLVDVWYPGTSFTVKIWSCSLELSKGPYHRTTLVSCSRPIRQTLLLVKFTCLLTSDIPAQASQLKFGYVVWS